MESGNGLSLQDRIKALNLSKVVPPSPQKNKFSPSEKPEGVTKEASLSTKQGSPYHHHADAKKSREIDNRASGDTQAETKSIPDLPRNKPTPTARTSPPNALEPCETTTYDTAPKPKPSSPGRKSLPNLIPCASETAIYTDIPTNRPLACPRPLGIPKCLSETALYSGIPNNKPLFPDDGRKQPGHENRSIYEAPGTILETDESTDRPIIAPEEINSRWKRLRQTVKDPRMRTMVDMSTLLPSSPDDVINNDDVVKTTSVFKRSQSLGDNLFLAGEGQGWKSPSLSVLDEKSGYPELSTKIDTPPGSALTPEFGNSRESSFKSTHSHSSGSRISGNYSDVSETSYESGRPRNYSDVSVTFEEGNYMAFETLNDTTKDNLLPNERTLIIVKGDKEYLGKLTLETDEAPQSPRISTDSPRSISSSSEEQSPAHIGKKSKGKKFKKFGKLTKAVKSKLSSPGVPQSPSKVLTSPSKHLTPTLQRPMTPSSGRMSPTNMYSARHMTHSAVMMTSPRKSPLMPDVSPKRPISMFPEIKAPSVTSQEEDEGIYYDPTTQNEDEDDSDLGDTITIEVIEDDVSDDVTEHEYLYKPLTSQNRSQSLASLNMELTESFGNNRRLSENIGGYTMFQMPSSTPPIPPPKYKSLRKKAERKLAESEGTDIASSTYMTSTNEHAVKLRQKKINLTDYRQDWPNGRPPSMPSQMPPAPPRPLSMPPDEPPEPETADQEGHEHNTSAFDISPTRPPSQLPRVPMKPKAPPTSSKPIVAVDKSFEKMQSGEESELDDSVYYTVVDPDSPTTTPSPQFNTEPEYSIPPDAGTGIYMEEHKTPSSSGPDRISGTTVRLPGYKNLPLLDMQAKNISPIKPSPPTPSKLSIKQEKPDSVSGNMYKLPGYNNPSQSDNRDVKFSYGTAAPNMQVKPEKPKPPGKPFTGTKPSTVLKPHIPTPGGASDDISKSKADQPDPNTDSSNVEVNGVKNGSSDDRKPSIPSRDPIIPVRPPPRPLKAKKFQNSVISAQNDASPPKNSNIDMDSLRTAPRSPAIAELGKLISLGSPMSPKHLKTAQKSARTTDIALNNQEKLDETNLTRGDTSPTSESIRKPGRPTLNGRVPSTLTSHGAISGTITSSTNSQDESNTANARESSLNKQTSPSSEQQPSISRKPGPRRPPKRPTTAPPPRPSGPPPPRPDKMANEKMHSTVTTPVAQKAAPPSRPPPPSSEKIKAAEERRKLNSVQDSFEDEYNDLQIKHSIEEDNPYADIDDDAFDAARGNRRNQKELGPSPSSRPKNTMRKAVHGINVINTMKGRLGRQKKNHVDKMAGKHTKPIVTEQGIYNEDTEESVYAGIDE